MAGFYHYISGVSQRDLVKHKQFDRALIQQVGLGVVLRDCSHVPDHVVLTDVPTGPDGKAGVCLYPKTPADPPGWSYRPEHQEWRQSLDGCRWVGWERDAPPTPADLARRDVYQDYRVFDRLQQEWMIPCARHGSGSLPMDFSFSAEGIRHHPSPNFSHLWTLSGQVVDHLRGTGTEERDEAWEVLAALKVLQVNYRLDKTEINALQEMGRGVLTRMTVAAILLAFIDRNLEDEAIEQKKTSTTTSPPGPSAADCSNASSGTAADCQDTAPHAER